MSDQEEPQMLTQSVSAQKNQLIESAVTETWLQRWFLSDQCDCHSVSASCDETTRQVFRESGIALGDRFWLFIQTLNNAKKPFNSIFNSKRRSNYSFKESIHSIKIPNYSFK